MIQRDPRHAGSVLGRARRAGLLSAAAALMLAAACGGGGDAEDGGSDGPAPDSGAALASATPSATQAAPAAARPAVPAEASAAQDSIHEAQLYHKRMASMEGIAGCLAKAKDADPPQRAVLEAACRRSRGAAP